MTSRPAEQAGGSTPPPSRAAAPFAAPFAWREVTDSVPRAVWAVVALHLALLLLWSVLTPIYEAPDEPQHVDLARAVAMELAYPEYDGRMLSEQVTESFRVTGFSETGDVFQRSRQPVVAVEAPPRPERPEFADLAPDEPSDNINPAPQHPPLYYTAAALVVAALPDGVRFDLVVWALRLLSVLCLLPLPLLVFAAGRRLTGERIVGTIAAVLLLAVPQYLHIGGAVNPDNVLTLQFAALLLLLVAVAQGDLRWRTAVWVGLVTALALLTKGFALILPAWVGSAYLIGAVRTGRRAEALRGLVLAGGVGGGLGAWWWLRNIVVHGDIQTTVQRFRDAGPGFEPSFSGWAEPALGYLVERFWGSFGWVDVTLADEVVQSAGWTLGLLIALAFALRPTGARWWRADLVLALLPVITIFAVMSYGSYETYAQSGRLTGMQGRYLFAGLPGLAVTAGVGLRTLTRRWARAVPLVALLAAGWIQWLAFRLVLFFWYGHPGIEDLRISGAALLAWAPVPRWVAVGMIASLLLAGLWLLAESVLLLASPTPPEPTDPPGSDAAADAPGARDGRMAPSAATAGGEDEQGEVGRA